MAANLTKNKHPGLGSDDVWSNRPQPISMVKHGHWAAERAYTALLPRLVEGLKENGPEPVHCGSSHWDGNNHGILWGTRETFGMSGSSAKLASWGKNQSTVCQFYRSYSEKSMRNRSSNTTNSRISPAVCISGRCWLRCKGKAVDTLSCQHMVLGISAQGAIPAADLRFWRQKESTHEERTHEKKHWDEKKQNPLAI